MIHGDCLEQNSSAVQDSSLYMSVSLTRLLSGITGVLFHQTGLSYTHTSLSHTRTFSLLCLFVTHLRFNTDETLLPFSTFLIILSPKHHEWHWMCWQSCRPGFSSSSVLWRGRSWHINTKWITLRAVCGSGNAKLSLGGRLVEGFRMLALMKCIWLSHLRLLSDVSEMESYRSYSPQDDQRSRQSDISSHSSNELPRESTRYAHC